MSKRHKKAPSEDGDSTPPSQKNALRESDGDYFAKSLPGDLMKDDPSLNWFQKPHTVTMFIVAGIIVIIAAFSRDQSDTETNVKMYTLQKTKILSIFSILVLRFVKIHKQFHFPVGCWLPRVHSWCSACFIFTMVPFDGRIRRCGDS